jgi:hypothetical protein
LQRHLGTRLRTPGSAEEETPLKSGYTAGKRRTLTDEFRRYMCPYRLPAGLLEVLHMVNVVAEASILHLGSAVR